MNEQLEEEINEYKRADTENRVIIKRMHEELVSKRAQEAAQSDRIEQLEQRLLATRS